MAVHAECSGTLVNRKGMAQQFKRAVLPPEGIKPAWEAIAALSKAVGKDIGLGSINEVRAQLPQSATTTQEAQV